MSAKYQYLKLSLRYVHGAKSTTLFSYPSSEKAGRPAFNAPAILKHFVNLTEFYVMGCHDDRRYFSFVSVDDANPGGARLELTLSLEADVLMPGRTIVNIFNSIKDMLEHEEPLNDESANAALSASGFPDEPLRSPDITDCNDLTDRPCCRTFVSANDLGTILSFPRQKAYEQYSEVVLVHVTTVADPESPLPQVTGPVQQAFTVVCPEGVTPSARTVVITDKLSLTYTRAGFEPATVNFEVGTTNRFVRISGPALLVNDAAKAAIVFVQKVEYKVTSSKGTPVNTYTILINGRTATRADGVFEVTSNDFNKDGLVNIAVSSTNFFTTSLDYTSEELASQQPLDLILVPEEMPVVLRLDFGEGRLMEQELLFEKSSTEYRQLRAGTFHGFRAHRLMSHDPETYNVDMTAPAAPKDLKGPKDTKETPAAKEPVAPAPAEAPAAKETAPGADSAQETKEADRPRKQALTDRPRSAAELRAERLRKDIPSKPDETEKTGKTEKPEKRKKAYANDIPRKVDILEDDPDDDDVRGGAARRLLSPVIIAVVAVVLITAGIVWYIFKLLPDSRPAAEAVDITAPVAGDSERIVVIDDVNAGDVAPDQGTAPAAQAETAQSAAPTADEKADIAYLNSHDTWRLADLKSEKYRAFFNSLGEGNIEAIVNSDYFAVNGQATNKKAVSIADYLWAAKGTFAQSRNVNALKNLQGKETIDVHALYELLARMRDPEPNKSERPRRDQ